MIRILQVVTNTGRGGLETVLMNYYRNIDRSKVQFDFLRHRNQHEAYDDEMRKLGGQIFELPYLNPWSNNYLRQLNAFFANHPEYKIVHVHQDCMSSVILKAANKNNVPVRIAHSHSSSQDKNVKYPLKLYYRSQIPKYTTDYFACSKEAGDWTFKNNKYQILNNAINTELYKHSDDVELEVRNANSIKEDAFVLTHIGRFAAVKNHSFLVDIFSEVKKIIDNAVLLLVGNGELMQETENKVRSLGLTDSVKFMGLRSDVNRILQATDVFVMPSIYEGLPVSLIEAQASGVPCVICDHFSAQCDMTQLTNRISLNSSSKEWAELIVSLKGLPRQDHSSEITKAGFDIKANAKWLEEYYINKWEENK